MTRVAIIGCGAAKLDRPAPARELYTGPLFRAARDHVEAERLPYRILSALHRVIGPDDVRAVAQLVIESGRPVFALLGPTRNGQPRHPLMAAYSTPLVPVDSWLLSAGLPQEAT